MWFNATVTLRAPVWWAVAVVALSFGLPSLVLLLATGEFGAMIVLAVPMVGAFTLVVASVVGLLGHDRSWTRTASFTSAAVMMLVWLVVMVAAGRWDAWLLLPAVFAVTWVFATLAAMIGWNGGDAVRRALGRPGAADLFAPATAADAPLWERTTDRYDWLADADPYLADTVVEAVRSRAVVGEEIRAAVPAVALGRWWSRPLGVAVTDRRLVLVPVTIRGRADGEPVSILPTEIDTVSVRTADDAVTVTTVDGGWFRFALPFTDRSFVGDVDTVLAWLRAHQPPDAS